MGQIKIKRLKEWANRRFSYKVIVGGQELFEISNGQERTVDIDKPVTIQAKLMWGGSDKIDIHADRENIREIRISANKWTNIGLPITALSIIILFSVINLVYPDNEAKGFMTGMLGGMIFGLIILLTIGRNKFLDIELIKE